MNQNRVPIDSYHKSSTRYVNIYECSTIYACMCVNEREGKARENRFESPSDPSGRENERERELITLCLNQFSFDY